jgi:aerobic-type carbon monoxide dehydrogenase small subunit (CoxS/CutS family)
MTALRSSLLGYLGNPVQLTVNGHPVDAFAGESVAAVLMAAGMLMLRRSPRAGGARGAFCFMGVCQECLVKVNGVKRQACLVEAEDGLVIEAEDPQR